MERIEFLTEFILQSDRIERISDNRSLLEDQICEGKENGHVGAILFLEKLAEDKSGLLTEKDIKNVQGLITAEQELKDPNLKLAPRHIGEYRDVPVEIFGRKCASPKKVPSSMLSLISGVNHLQKNWRKMTELQVIGDIAGFYFDFEMLHPFRDGNGRTGRALVFYLMKYIGREPFIFTEEEMYVFHFPSLQYGERKAIRKYFWDKSGIF